MTAIAVFYAVKVEYEYEPVDVSAKFGLFQATDLTCENKAPFITSANAKEFGERFAEAYFKSGTNKSAPAFRYEPPVDTIMAGTLIMRLHSMGPKERADFERAIVAALKGK